MKVSKIIVAGILVTVFNAILGGLTCGYMFSWIYRVPPVCAWKPMTGPPGMSFYIGSLLVSILLAAVYAVINKGIPGKSLVAKGLNYGFYVWAVGLLPGMFFTNAFMQVSCAIVIYMTVMGLLRLAVNGLIISLVLRTSE